MAPAAGTIFKEGQIPKNAPNYVQNTHTVTVTSALSFSFHFALISFPFDFCYCHFLFGIKTVLYSGLHPSSLKIFRVLGRGQNVSYNLRGQRFSHNLGVAGKIWGFGGVAQLEVTFFEVDFLLGGEASFCMCTPWSHRAPFGLFLEKQGARTPWRASWPTKTTRQGGENTCY